MRPENFKFFEGLQHIKETAERQEFSALWKKIKKEIKKRGRVALVYGISTLAVGTLVNKLEDYSEDVHNDSANYVQMVEKSHRLTESEKQDLAKKLEYITSQLVPEVIGAMRDAAEVGETKADPVTMENFVDAGISDEVASETWDDNGLMLPEHTLKGNVTSVEFKEGTEEMSKHYGITGNASGKVVRDEKKIMLFHDTALNNIKDSGMEGALGLTALDIVMAHELGHMNDWLSKSGLTPQERVDFLYEVLRQYNQNSFIDSRYVEMIDNQDPRMEKTLKVSEWWAQVSEGFLTNPDSFQVTNQSEYRLAQKWLCRFDKKFVPEVGQFMRMNKLLANKHLK